MEHMFTQLRTHYAPSVILEKLAVLPLDFRLLMMNALLNKGNPCKITSISLRWIFIAKGGTGIVLRTRYIPKLLETWVVGRDL